MDYQKNAKAVRNKSFLTIRFTRCTTLLQVVCTNPCGSQDPNSCLLVKFV
nr:MAG TPA: hypothetical protein [Caudoviricetes sp.]